MQEGGWDQCFSFSIFLQNPPERRRGPLLARIDTLSACGESRDVPALSIPASSCTGSPRPVASQADVKAGHDFQFEFSVAMSAELSLAVLAVWAHGSGKNGGRKWGWLWGRREGRQWMSPNGQPQLHSSVTGPTLGVPGIHPIISFITLYSPITYSFDLNL